MRHSSKRVDIKRRENSYRSRGCSFKQIWRWRKLVHQWFLCWTRSWRANGWRNKAISYSKTKKKMDHKQNLQWWV